MYLLYFSSGFDQQPDKKDQNNDPNSNPSDQGKIIHIVNSSRLPPTVFSDTTMVTSSASTNGSFWKAIQHTIQSQSVANWESSMFTNISSWMKGTFQTFPSHDESQPFNLGRMVNLSVETFPDAFNFEKEQLSIASKGYLSLVLQDRPTPFPEIHSELHFMDGAIHLVGRDGGSSTGMYLQGFYLRPMRRVIMYSTTGLLHQTYLSWRHNVNTTTLSILNPHTIRTTPQRPSGCVLHVDLQVDRSMDVLDSRPPTFQDAIVKGTIDSPNCPDVALNISATPINRPLVVRNAIIYVCIFVASCAVQTILLITQMKRTSTSTSVSRVSMGTIAWQAMVDAYLCLFHLFLGLRVLQSQLFSSFVFAAFLKLIYFSVVEVRYMLIIWKARNSRELSVNGWQGVRRQLGAMYVYCFLILGMVLAYILSGYPVLLAVCAISCWVPQIVHNAHRNVCGGLSTSYLIGTTICRLMVPVYFFMCPANFLVPLIYESVVTPTAGWAALTWAAAEVRILYMTWCDPYPSRPSIIRWLSSSFRRVGDHDSSSPNDSSQ